MLNHMKRARRQKQVQLAFRFRSRGGKCEGAGRKRSVAWKSEVAHGVRPTLHEYNPVHVTMRAVGGVPNLRAELIYGLIERELRIASRKGLRVLQFSVQRNHVHLLVEAEDRVALARGIQRFASRVAMGINTVARRSGRLWRERYPRRDLTSPNQVRNALVYVIMNIRKH